VLGRRIAAALIDLAALTGLGLIMGLTVGESSVGGGGFSVSLSGMWLSLYLALALLYYFAFEATVGQTAGKRLLGLWVRSVDGGRPSAAAIAGRTLLRIIDWLPFMYLVGFIAMLATGERRQRVGDLAAGTVVARAPSAQRRGSALVPLAVVLLAVVGLVAYRATTTADTKTYRGHGISFDYPAAWDEVHLQSTTSAGGAESLWTVAVGAGAGPYDLITVRADRMDDPVTAESLPAAAEELAQLMGNKYKQLGGAVRSGPEEVTVGGKPGARFEDTRTVEGILLEATDVFVFDGTTEYQLECQHTRQKAVEVGQACDQVLRSFTIRVAVAVRQEATR
jgi:uncharacterized RDD family membrane protein YckC